MELENLGYGAGGGIFGAIVGFFGLKSRIDDVKKDFDEHKKRVVYRDTCERCHDNTNSRLDRIETKLDKLLDRMG